ncbi:MAG: phage DNA encapsidation protein, partial [Bacteroidales bacterium]|nr:phage DNA encapsidation protein [Bacteroidales bacterium]
MAKQKYYRLDRLDKIPDCNWFFLIGQRANGKSYAVKERVLTNAWEKHERFVYLRRYGKDIKTSNVTSYFDDMPIDKITKGNYTGIMAYQGYIYWYNIDEETQRPVKSNEPIGRYCALNEDARYKSQVFKDTTTIVYEEMIPNDSMYIENETSRIQHFVSTVFRQNDGKVYLIGNTLTRVCPYVRDFSLENFLRMKPGDIDIYNYHVGDKVVKLAVEYCATIQYESNMFFGKASKQILTGEWEVNEVNKLPGKMEDYENVYKVLIEYQNFKFVLNLLVDKKTGDKVVYIYPETKEFKGNRIITDRFDINPLVTSRLDLTRTPEKYIAYCFMAN